MKGVEEKEKKRNKKARKEVLKRGYKGKKRRYKFGISSLASSRHPCQHSERGSTNAQGHQTKGQVRDGVKSPLRVPLRFTFMATFPSTTKIRVVRVRNVVGESPKPFVYSHSTVFLSHLSQRNINNVGFGEDFICYLPESEPEEDTQRHR